VNTPSGNRLRVAPLTLREANAYVERHHRHSQPVHGMKFAVGAAVGDDLVGVTIVGRPVARHLQDGWTVEVLRVCSTGLRNVCSFLYGACWRAARALGFRRLVTYTRRDESGVSPRAAGFRVVGEVKAQSWDRPSRPRDDGDPQDIVASKLARTVGVSVALASGSLVVLRDYGHVSSIPVRPMRWALTQKGSRLAEELLAGNGERRK
jgi:hypothetical protein